ncbi:MAG TPA: alkaline phosphatase PafA, partial [Chitinophagaceae bacterium]|nr:alkaline phosphatase PafA [Chitinophagaceae bacterium]
KSPSANNIQRPKLVVGIVVDQMRWDYLYLFYDLYKTNGGFKRLMGEGFTCDNTFVPYLPTVTGCGHASVYTGSVPAINGITGNNWWDSNLKKGMYCVQDDSVKTVGSATDQGKMSPKNLLTTTLTDELRLASNFQSKVVGLSIKDRGAILPAGHSANAAYWYDALTGNFITSNYYMNELPNWMQDFNARKLVDSFYTQNWNLLDTTSVYEKYCDVDKNLYEAKPFGVASLGFPYNLQQFKGVDYSKISVTPFGNDLLIEAAKKIIENENLGKQEATDFLAVSFSSPDYIGHAFGPNSWEMLDNYLRLDNTIKNLLDYLDQTIGKDQYTIFLTADHAGANIPEFLQKNKIPAGRWEDTQIKNELNSIFEKEFSIGDLISSVNDYNVSINHDEIEYIKKVAGQTINLDEEKVKKMLFQYLLKKDMVLQVVDFKNLNSAALPLKIREMLNNGYNPVRSGDFQIIMKSGVIDGSKTGMTHGAWYNYDSHIPLLFYGWGIKHGSLNRETYMTDISATVAALLHIQMPSGCVGKVITEVMK